MKRLWALPLTVLTVAGCGGGSDSSEALSEALSEADYRKEGNATPDPSESS